MINPPAKLVTPPPAFQAPGLAQELLFTTMCVYGPTGSRKTTQIGEFAKHVYATTGKKTRLISVDPGGYGTIQPHINSGVIEVWRLVEETNIKAAISKASKGAWPKDLKNGLRSSSAILEPVQGKRKESLRDIGAYAVEGWSSIAKAVMRDTVAKGQKISEEVVGLFAEDMLGEVLSQDEVKKRQSNGQGTDGFELYGAPARAHYGFVQNYIQDIIRGFSALPVERVLYTALEGKGEDKLTKQLTYGPEVAGSAITAAIPAFVGDCLHFEDYTQDGGEDPGNKGQKLSIAKVRAWFQSHPDITPGSKAMWPAKTRVASDQVPEFRKLMGANGYFDLDHKHLGDYLQAQDDLIKSSTAALVAWKAEMDARRKGVESK